MPKYDWSLYEAYGNKLVERHEVPGAGVGVAVDGKPVYFHGFGSRDVEKKLPVDENTVFGIGSVTKSFTAVAIMQLQEQGKLSVEDPVVKYLPEFRVGKDGAEKAMTIHHFLTHTAGLPPLSSLNRALVRSLLKDESVMQGPAAEKIKALPPIDTYEELMEAIASQDFRLLGAPGLHFSYSNDAYALLGTIVERVSGVKYETYVVENILKPLGMTRSTWEPKDLPADGNVAMLYTSKREKGKDIVFASPSWWECPSMAAAGFLKSTVADMLRYAEIYRTGGVSGGNRILSAKSIEQMSTPYIEPTPGYWYGYGLMVHPNYHGVSLVEHGGNIKGASAYFTAIREKNITGVALTNLVSSPGGDLVLGAVNVPLGVKANARRFHYPKYHCPTERLSKYEGLYVSEEGASVKITAKEGGLDLEMEGGVHFKARPTGLDLFAMRRKGLESQMRFLVNARGEVCGLAFGFRIVRKVDAKPQTA